MNNTNADEIAGLNEFLHCVVMERCWCPDFDVDTKWSTRKCEDCGEPYERERSRPQYTADLNAAREAALKVIEKVGAGVYGHCLIQEIGGDVLKWYVENQFFDTAVEAIATADALTISRACRAAFEGENDE